MPRLRTITATILAGLGLLAGARALALPEIMAGHPNPASAAPPAAEDRPADAPAAPPPSGAAAAETPIPKLPRGTPDGWFARIETSAGVIVARLLPEQAPQAVAYFAALAEGRLPWKDPQTDTMREGRYYDGITVSKTVAGARFEVAGLEGTGRGAPPRIAVPPEENRLFDFTLPGRVGMVRSGLGRVSPVHFFVTVAGFPAINKIHTCFGEVVLGLDVAWIIASAKTGPDERPLEPVRIERIRLFRVGEAPPLPEPVPFTPPPLELRAEPAPKSESP